MNKTIYFDFDNTIANPHQRFLDLYSKNEYNWTDLKEWGFKDLFPNITHDEISDMFARDDFFEELEPHIDVDGYSMIDLINSLIEKGLDVGVCTYGCTRNLELKKEWLSKHIPNLDLNNFIGLEYGVTKDVGNNILIDDNLSFLLDSKSEYKILFMPRGIVTGWNEGIDAEVLDSVYVSTSISYLKDTLNDIRNVEDFIS